MKLLFIRLFVVATALLFGGVVVAQRGEDYTPAVPQVVGPKKNTPPRLSSSSRVMTKVSPVAGASGEDYTFGIEYLDADGDPCSPCQVWIDLNQDGKYSANEKFDMALIDDSDKEVPRSEWSKQFWTGWRRFTFKMPITNHSLDTRIVWKFYFRDGYDDPSEIADYIKEQSVTVRPAIIVDPEEKKYEAVSGGVLRVDISVYLEQKVSKQLAFKWDQVDNMPLPKGLTLHERKVSVHRANKDYDVAELTLYFDIDRNMEVGTYHLKFPKMIYEITLPIVDPKKPAEKKMDQFNIPSAELKISSILVRNPVVTARALTMGTSFDYIFSVSLNAKFEDKDALVGALRAQTFLPLRLATRDVVVTEQAGGATEVSVRYVLSIEDGPPGQYQIPGFAVGSITLPPRPIMMFPIDPPGKAPEGQKEMAELQKSILQIATPIIPSGVSQPRVSPWYFGGGGGIILTILSFFFGRAGLDMYRMRVARRLREAKLAELYGAYVAANGSFKETNNVADLTASYHALREFLVMKYEGKDISLGVFARDLPLALEAKPTDSGFAELAEIEMKYFTTT